MSDSKMTAISCSPGALGHGPFWSFRTPTNLRTASSSPVSDASERLHPIATMPVSLEYAPATAW